MDDLVNANSGGLNKQKIQVKKEYPGDNPLNVMANESEITEEQLSITWCNSYKKEEAPLPLTSKERKQLFIQKQIELEKQRRRISMIKSTKLQFSTNNINISAGKQTHNMNRLFKFVGK